MAATLSSEIGSTEKIVKLIEDCRKMGIDVLPPDVNESSNDFSVIAGRIRFGLCAIKKWGRARLRQFCAPVARGKIPQHLRLLQPRRSPPREQEMPRKPGAGRCFRFMERIGPHTWTTWNGRHRSRSPSRRARRKDSRVCLNRTPGGAAVYPAMNEISPWIDAEKLAGEVGPGFFVSGHPLMKFKREIEDLPQ